MSHPSRPLRTVAMLSGSGSTLQNLLDRAKAGQLPIHVTRVISSKPGVYGLTRAEQAGIATSTITRKSYDSWQDFNQALTDAVDAERPDIIVLAGFLSLFWPGPAYAGRIFNVHPALIPAFCGKGMYGHHVHQAVIESGVKITGCTVHFVDDQYDHGPIIIQRALEVRDDDTPESLADRVQALEREALPEAIQLYAHNRLRIAGRRVLTLPETP